MGDNGSTKTDYQILEKHLNDKLNKLNKPETHLISDKLDNEKHDDRKSERDPNNGFFDDYYYASLGDQEGLKEFGNHYDMKKVQVIDISDETLSEQKEENKRKLKATTSKSTHIIRTQKQSFETQEKSEEYQRKIKPIFTYTCELCDLQFRKNKYLSEHKRRDHCKSMFVCEFCEAQFDSILTL